MAKRQDSGSHPAHQNERPTPHHDDALPEMTEDPRGRASDEDDDEFEDTEELDEDEDEGDKSSF
jgi:hypothetical protein